jgi:hypothetical protein
MNDPLDTNADLNADMNEPLTHEMAALPPHNTTGPVPTGQPRVQQQPLTAEQQYALDYQKYLKDLEAYNK